MEMEKFELEVEELEIEEQMGLPDWATRTLGVIGMVGCVTAGITLT